ncbi:hypothetical protein [Priestia endophytica]|uniref:hypothetical protein n=1 Tax=Priestia endophytica TaxID=135735 RepID=UPI002E1D710C|nr:hypothetical protein [Priestia endophytica]
MKKTFLTFPLIGMLTIGTLAGCGTSEENTTQNGSDTNSTSETNNNAATNESATSNDLKQYARDDNEQDDGTEDDFDLVGTLESEKDNELVMMIDNEKVTVKKASSFKTDEPDNTEVKGKLVKVEVNAKNEEAESLELMPQAKADDNGVYDKEKDGEYNVIGTFVKEDDKSLTVKVKSGEKTYEKTADFEHDDDSNQDLKDKVVRLEVTKDDKVESVEMNTEDQDTK